MRKPLQPYYLFNDKFAAVTPSWVRFDNTSFTVRSIMAMDFKIFKVPRPAKYSLFFFSLFLVAYSGVHVANQILPQWLAKTLLGASLIVFAYAVWLAFIKRVHYQITITMFDGTQAFNRRYKFTDAQNLREAITRAMDWHQGCSGGGQVPMIDTIASRRKTAKTRVWANSQR